MPIDRDPTHEDAQLVLRLYDLRREAKLRDARAWFMSRFSARNAEEFQTLCPAGSENLTFFRMHTTYWEMAASFVTSGILESGLFFQSNMEAVATWIKIRHLVPELRKTLKNPAAYRNLEMTGRMAEQYLNGVESGAWAAFVSRWNPYV